VKLSDPKPLTPAERHALIRGHAEIVKCRHLLTDHDRVFAAWELPRFQAYFARQDALFTKLASGEMPVGAANQLQIASLDQFQVEQSRGQADETRFRQVQAERFSEAAMAANATMAANRPRMTTTNCTWMGNSINCTGMN